MISQWIEGKTLRAANSVSPEIFCGYLRQVCSTMAEVHQAGIIHGDLTPSNILINHSDQITITDFGFSQRPTDKAHAVETDGHAGLLLGGTVGFAAPEQFSTALGAIGPQTDIYALGAIAYWYLTGRAPHQNHSIGDAIGDTISESNVELNSHCTALSTNERILSFAKMALQKAVSHRPDIASLIQVLP